MQIVKFKVAILVVLIVLSGIITIYAGASFFEKIIPSSGSIIYGPILTRPLHTDGRYVKDDVGRIVNLRGVFKAEFVDTCAGWFPRIGYDPSYDGYVDFGGDGQGLGVHQMCQVLRDEWGANFVGIFIDADWWIRNAQETLSQYEPITTIGCREAIKGFISIASEYGIYVMISVYRPSRSDLERMPYPTNRFPTKEDFIDFYVNDLANELKDYNNVIFCPFDEPVPPGAVGQPGETMEGWTQVVQDIINGIRALPCDNLFLYHAGYCGSISWIWNYPLAGTNIVYSGTVYRFHGTFDPSCTSGWACGGPTDYNSVKAILEEHGYRYVAENLSLPLVNYIGTAWGATDDDEYDCFVNVLKCWNEWKQGYASYQWHRSELMWTIQQNTLAIQPPNRVGQALIDAITTDKT